MIPTFKLINQDGNVIHEKIVLIPSLKSNYLDLINIFAIHFTHGGNFDEMSKQEWIKYHEKRLGFKIYGTLKLLDENNKVIHTYECVNKNPYKYNHMFDFAFEVNSNDEMAKDITSDILRKACIDRINNISNDEILEACGLCDTYENNVD